MSAYDLESPGNYVLGAGYIFVRDPDEDAWYYLAESPNLTVSVESEKLALWSSDAATAEKLEEPVTQITRSGSTSFRDINGDTLRRFFAATKSTVVEAGSAANTEDFVVTLGTYIQLGTNDANAPAYGYRGVTINSINEDPDGTPVALVEGTDYEVDTEEGLIRILEGATNVATGDTIRVDYDVDATSTEVVQTGASASEELEMKFVGSNTVGTNRTFHFPKVDMSGAGELALKSRDTFMEVPVQFEILDPGDGRAAVYILTKPE